MLFEGVIENVPLYDFFKSTDKLMIRITDSVGIHIDNEGLKIAEVVCNNVAMVRLTIPKESFDVFNADGEIDVAVNIKDVVDALKNAKKNDSVKILVTDKDVTLSYGKRRYGFAIVEKENMSMPPEPKIDFTVSVVVDSKMFIDTIKEIVRYIKDSINRVVIYARHGITNDYSLTLECENSDNMRKYFEEIPTIKEYKIPSEGVKAKYDADILFDAAPMFKHQPTMKIEYAENNPMKITSECEKYKYEFYIAPVIEDE